MIPSGSTAVMARRVEAPDSLDDFPTPSWGTRALLEYVIRPYMGLPLRSVWEPACNRGYMARPLHEYFGRVYMSDVFDYSAEFAGQERVVDFLWPDSESPVIAAQGVDWVITNPPFLLAEQFIWRARNLARVGVAIFVRMQFLEGQGRFERLFSIEPPTLIAQFAERIILTKGIVRDPNKEYWDEEAQKMRRPSTATSYLWLVWLRNKPRAPFQWIPPCRLELERPGDYPASVGA